MSASSTPVEQLQREDKEKENNNKEKVVICIPTLPQVDLRWAFTFYQILTKTQPGTPYFAEWRYGVAESREKLVRDSLGTIPDITHVMFLDTDVIPPVDCIPALLAHKKPVVAGIYYNSLLTGLSAWIGERALTTADINIIPKEKPLLEVDRVGMGCCLIEADVFKKLDTMHPGRPFFYYTVYEKINAKEARLQSEDFYFFERCALDMGIKPLIDTRVRCSHIKPLTINADGSAF